MFDPIALESIETPIISTRKYIIYRVHNVKYNYDSYSLTDKHTGDEVICSTLQECFDYIANGYNI